MTHVFHCKPSTIDELKQVVYDFATSMDAKMMKKSLCLCKKDICKSAQGVWGPLSTHNVIFRFLLCIKIEDLLMFICYDFLKIDNKCASILIMSIYLVFEKVQF